MVGYNQSGRDSLTTVCFFTKPFLICAYEMRRDEPRALYTSVPRRTSG